MKFALERVLATALVLPAPILGACDTADGPPATTGQTSTPSTARPSTGAPQAPSSVPEPPTFTCDGSLGSLTIELPCQVGLPLATQGGISAVECAVRTTGTTGKVSLVLPLDQISRNLNSPVDLSAFPVAPVSSINGLILTGLGGTAVFSAVDVKGRAFLGRFADASLTFSPGGAVCRIHDGPLSAVPGQFL